VEISKESAILLLGAIISNTLNFKGTVTTDRDRKAAEYLNKVARLDDNFWKELFTAKSDLSGSKLAERMRGDFAWFVIGKKKVGIAQIEIIGAEKLVTERGDEIVRELESIKLEMGLDLVFQTTIGLDENMNVFVTGDAETRAILEKVLNVKFNGNIAKPTGLIMRKQIVPLLKGELEGV
jgi:manganese-dependent inorganic pyrophosphatase